MLRRGGGPERDALSAWQMPGGRPILAPVLAQLLSHRLSAICDPLGSVVDRGLLDCRGRVV